MKAKFWLTFSAGIVVALAAGVPYLVGYFLVGRTDPGVDTLGSVDGTGNAGGSVKPAAGGSFEELTGEPLFALGSLYLEGRSSWCRQRFEEDREAIGEKKRPTKPDVTTKVVREPFTDGRWLAELPAEDLAIRKEAEAQVVVVEAFFTIEGVTAAHLLNAVVCSDFRLNLPTDPATSYEALYPGEPSPGECLPEVPRLGSHEMMTREFWGASFQRKATDVWFVNRVGRDAGAYYQVFEAWKNCPREGSYVNIKMSCGQYVIEERDDDCVVFVRTYYSGQNVPNFWGVGGIISARTRRFYEGLASTLQETVPGWEPDERARRWIEGLSWTGEAAGS